MNAPHWRWTVAAFIFLALSGCSRTSSPNPSEQKAAAPAASPPAIEARGSTPSAPVHDLSADEALGGHTLQRHVGKSDADLIERLRREPQISSASTYTDRETAERLIAAALQADNRALAAWRKRSGRRPNFVVRYRADHVIGRSIARGHSNAVSCDRSVIVLRWDDRRRRDYVLTSYPEPGR